METTKTPMFSIRTVHCGYPPLMKGFDYRKSDYCLEFYKGGGIRLLVGGYLPNLLEPGSVPVEGAYAGYRLESIFYGKEAYIALNGFIEDNKVLLDKALGSKKPDSRVGGTLRTIMLDGKEASSYEMDAYLEIEKALFGMLEGLGISFDDDGSHLKEGSPVKFISEKKATASLF